MSVILEGWGAVRTSSMGENEPQAEVNLKRKSVFDTATVQKRRFLHGDRRGTEV